MSTATATTAAAGALPDWAIYETPHLRAWRLFAGLGRPELARETGISISLVVALETERCRASGRTLNRIAAALDMPATVLHACGPLDRRARHWADKAARRGAERRLTYTRGGPA